MESKVLGVTALPPTGPANSSILLSLAIMAIISSIILKLNKNIIFRRG